MARWSWCDSWPAEPGAPRRPRAEPAVVQHVGQPAGAVGHVGVGQAPVAEDDARAGRAPASAIASCTAARFSWGGAMAADRSARLRVRAHAHTNLDRGPRRPARARLGACGDDDDAADDASTERHRAPTRAASDDGGGGDADVTIADFAFDPTTLTVAAGDSIPVTNEDGTAHTFTSADGGFDVELGGGESGEATVAVGGRRLRLPVQDPPADDRARSPSSSRRRRQQRGALGGQLAVERYALDGVVDAVVAAVGGVALALVARAGGRRRGRRPPARPARPASPASPVVPTHEDRRRALGPHRAGHRDAAAPARTRTAASRWRSAAPKRGEIASSSAAKAAHASPPDGFTRVEAARPPGTARRRRGRGRRRPSPAAASRRRRAASSTPSCRIGQ